MLTWKLLVPVAAVLLGAGIAAADGVPPGVRQKAGFACVAPWYKDSACGIPNISIPPQAQLEVIVDAVTKDGKRYQTENVCPTVRIYDAKNDKLLETCEHMCDRGLCPAANRSKETSRVVYVRFSTAHLESVDVRGKWWVIE